MPPPVREALFGEIVVRAGLCTNTQVGECLDLQEKLRREGQPVPRLGELLTGRNYVKPEQIRALLKGGAAGDRFGQVAVNMSLCFPADVERALATQEEEKRSGGRHRLIGEVLVGQGALESHHIEAVLRAMGLRVEACKGCGAPVNIPADADGAACPACGKRAGTEERAEPVAPLPEAPEAAQDDASRMAKALETAAPPQPEAAAADDRKAAFGGYLISARLGVNATGGLYLARKSPDGPTVTIKIFSTEMSRDPDFAANFKTAAKYGVLLKHEGINSVLDVGRDRGRYYCVSEYVKGRSLRYLLEKQGRLPQALVLDIARQAAAALAYAHSQGVVHGDIKPSNIILDPQRKVRIANFGVVNNPLQNLLAVSKVSGAAPIYAAPELAVRGAVPTARSDVYSLGATVYHMLTGQAPHQGSSPVQTMMRLAQDELKPPSALVPGTPEALDRVVMAMLSVEPKERHSEMSGVIEDLDALQGAAAPAAAPAAKPASKPAAKPAAAAPADEADAASAEGEAAPTPSRGRLVGVVLCVLLLLACVGAAATLVITAPPTPKLPEVRPLPQAAPDSPVLKDQPPARRPLGR